MDCANTTTDIIVSITPKTKFGCTILGVSEDGQWNHVYNEYTGNTTYVPIDPDYFNTCYHANKQLITCDICGSVILKILDSVKELCRAD